MRRSRYIAELEYNAYIKELKKGKKVDEAIRDAWEKGAPQAFIEYESLWRHIASRHNHGDYYHIKHKDLRKFLDVIYEWWLTHRPAVGSRYICLLERMEQPAPWPWSLETFRTHIYKYMRLKS